MSAIIKVFEFENYKRFVIEFIHQMPKHGHGQFLKIAKALNVHTTMVTHVFKGDLHLNPEQSLALADYLGLNELETEYFLNLIQLARAGDQRTKKYFSKQLSVLKNRALNLGSRLEVKNSLDERDQSMFYSSWIFAAIRLLSAIPKFQSAGAIAEQLELPQSKINKALEFLISRGLCIEKNGKIIYGDVNTYVEQNSPLVSRHHINWRLKVTEKLDRLQTHELAYTYPVVISAKDYAKIREELVKFIEQFKKISDPSPSEQLCCLNIDWVEVIK